jgi:hypothetical protein
MRFCLMQALAKMLIAALIVSPVPLQNPINIPFISSSILTVKDDMRLSCSSSVSSVSCIFILLSIQITPILSAKRLHIFPFHGNLVLAQCVPHHDASRAPPSLLFVAGALSCGSLMGIAPFQIAGNCSTQRQGRASGAPPLAATRRLPARPCVKGQTPVRSVTRRLALPLCA